MVRTCLLRLGIQLGVWLGCCCVLAVAEQNMSFETQVAPLLSARCLGCHSDQLAEGNLSFSNRRSFQRGGDSGSVVVAGDPQASLLVEMVSGATPSMPQDADPLRSGEIAVLRRWIANGAEWPAHLTLEPAQVSDTNWWSLSPLVAPPLPDLEVAESDWARTPVDAFVISRLRQQGLSPSPQAHRRTLIRRLYFDLWGLPPTFEEVEQFVSDRDPRAYEKLVDRLLASPHYGERWARHWLDVVHYGDTHGYDKDKPRPNAWPYRDYVIRSFNEDKPYGRFVQEQIAGDRLWPHSRDGIEATGFIAAGPWDFIGHAEVPETKIDGQVARHLDRDDMVSSTMNTFTSMTVQCARCHNHKFDPVTQEHYYSLQAVFAALDRADREYDIDPEVSRRRAELEADRSELKKRQQALRQQVRQFGGRPLATVETQLNEINESEATSDQQKTRLVELARRRTQIIDRKVPRKVVEQLDDVTHQLDQVNKRYEQLPTPSRVYCGTIHTGSGAFRGTGHNGGEPREIRILARGNILSPGKQVQPGTVPVIEGIDWQFDLPADHCEGDRRVALAQWLVRRDNPLTWRSIVNRVWQYHFGKAIVSTPNDFGRMGQLPSHPKLLDWLAAHFRDNGQSIKDLHRMIVCSSAYRQVSMHNAASAEIDADNRLLWRMNRRALDAESIRDAMLQVSGKLDRSLYGPPFQDFVIQRPEHSPHYKYHLHDPNDPESHRRSIYRFLVRSQQHPFMETLDCADPSRSVAKRDTTLTSLQALAMLNNKFVLCMAEHFADRARQSAPALKGRVRFIIREALGREASEMELTELSQLSKQHSLEYACRTVMNLNEFVFVD